MSISLVGFCHLMNVFLLLDGGSGAIGGIDDFASKFLVHGLLVTKTGITHEPTKAESLFSFWSNFDWNLIVSSSDTANLEFDFRHNVINGGSEDIDGLFLGLVFNDLKAVVNDGLACSAFAIKHDTVD